MLFGGSKQDLDERSGGRFSGGSGSMMLIRSASTAATSSWAPARPASRRVFRLDARFGVDPRPFFDVLTGTQNSQLVASSLTNGTNILTATGLGLASGNIHASWSSRLQGAEMNAFCCLCSDCNYWVQMLGGVRYLQLNEGVAITETTQVNSAAPLGSPFFGGSTISIADRVDTRISFYGGQVGLRGEVRSGRVFVEARGTVALGGTREVVNIHGTTAITPPSGAGGDPGRLPGLGEQ